MKDNLIEESNIGSSKRFICLIIFVALSIIFLITTIVFITLYINEKNDGENTDTKNSENDSPKVEDRFIKVLSRVSESGGAYMSQGKHDIIDSPYFKYVDIFNTKSKGSLILLEKYKTYQQTSEYTCGIASLIMAVYHLDGTVLNETEMAIKAKSAPDAGTIPINLEKVITELGYDFDSPTKYVNNTDELPTRNEEVFAEYIKKTLKNNESIIIASNDWGGHYSNIIGYDDMGTDNIEDDVIFLADPYDTTDHINDGFTIFNYERYYAQMLSPIEGLEASSFLARLASKGLHVEKQTRPAGSCVIVANHASAIDLYTISAFGFDNIVYITKGWVFKLPFFRYVMNGAGYIDAETTTPEEILARCKNAVEKGCDIVFFPQGSRKDPQARFKSGAFYLAKELNLPVVPVGIAGTQKMLPAGKIMIEPARLVLKMFPVIAPKDYVGELGHLHMAQAAKKQIMDFFNEETKERL